MPVNDVSFTSAVISRLPQWAVVLIRRHHELIKFILVGGTTMVFDLAIFYGLTFTVLADKPTAAKIISSVLATILSYILNREWAFKNRGGRERHHEALLFFGISGMGVLISSAPIFFANNIFHLRDGLENPKLLIFDFALNYILGNFLQLIFRFWALRKFAFPNSDGIAAGSIELPESVALLDDEELGHS